MSAASMAMPTFSTSSPTRKIPEHRDTRRWAGGHFDLRWFDREMIDKDVNNALRTNRRIRLRQPRPKRPIRGHATERAG
jgi:hypothetical protein